MKKILSLALLFCIMTGAYGQTVTDTVGIYAVLNGVVTPMEKITHQAIKGSGGLASVATFGVAKIKSKLEFNGETSPYQFDKEATIRLYFGNPALQNISKLYMFTPTYSAKDFDIARFEVKKKKRMLTGVSASILGSSVGVTSADNLQISTTELRPNVYDIKVKGKPGEYCVMFTGNGTGGFGGVYDFTIK